MSDKSMIVLYGFGPLFGLPDPSPFVMKTEVQLKMAGIRYAKERAAPPTAPKGKIPFIDDAGVKIGDSTFIRAHIEETRGLNLDRGLSADERARAWAVERMLEDHLYFALLHFRWMIDENFAKGPALFFKGAPDAVRDGARERVKQNLYLHGLGRHSDSEIVKLAGRSLASLSATLNGKPYLMGNEPCGADATAFAMVSGILTPYFDTPLRDAALSHKNLVTYSERMMDKYFPQFVKQAA
jgi:glutathione S-transferase